MATGVPSKNGVQKSKIPVFLTYDGKEDVASVLSHPFNQYYVHTPINGGGTNRFYFGDNLEVLLYLLNNGYKGKIRLVYIDPPFATTSVFVNRDQEHAYSDSLTGGEFVEFLSQRLILL